MTLRPIRAFREINRDLTRLRDDERAAEARARVELTQRARTFSRTSRKVVDETMSLSAVLMRAGEVEEASRLLAEVDREVECEKAALIETVTEAKARKAIARHKMTRLRLARLVVTAILGTSLMGASAFGVVLARYLAPNPAQGATASAAGSRSDEARGADRAAHEIRFAGVKIALTPKQLAEFERLTAAGDNARLEAFLRKVLSGKLADKIVATAAGLKGSLDDAGKKIDGLLDQAKKAVKDSSSGGASTSGNQESKGKKSSSNGDDNDSGNEPPPDERCEDDDDDEGGGEQSSWGPVGGCIPVVNEESPV